MIIEERFQPFIKRAVDSDPFFRFMNYELIEFWQGHAKFRFFIETDKYANSRSVAHGGALAAFSETVMEWACRSYGRKVVTLETKLNYMRPIAVGTAVYGSGIVIHAGKQTMVAECEFRDEKGQLAVKGQASFFVSGSFDMDIEFESTGKVGH